MLMVVRTWGRQSLMVMKAGGNQMELLKKGLFTCGKHPQPPPKAQKIEFLNEEGGCYAEFPNLFMQKTRLPVGGFSRVFPSSKLARGMILCFVEALG